MTAPSPLVGMLFIVIAVILFGSAYRDLRKAEGGRPLARRTWVRIGIIFTIVGVGLQLVHLLGGS